MSLETSQDSEVDDEYQSSELRMNTSSSAAKIEQDSQNSIRTYCTWRFQLGLFLMVVALINHIYMVRFLDLTLISANTAVNIVAAIVLSTNILGERFIWQYDLVALFLISLGCALIVINANTVQTEYTAEEVVALLRSPRTICFISFTLFCIVLSVLLLKAVLHRLRIFEKDAETYQRRHP